MLKEISLLPSKIVLGNVEDHFTPPIGVNGLGRHALAPKMHMRGISHCCNSLRQRKAGSDLVRAISWRNQKIIVPDLVLRDFMPDGFLRKHKADAGAVFNGFLQPIAVMHLELQIGAGWSS